MYCFPVNHHCLRPLQFHLYWHHWTSGLFSISISLYVLLFLPVQQIFFSALMWLIFRTIHKWLRLPQMLGQKSQRKTITSSAIIEQELIELHLQRCFQLYWIKMSNSFAWYKIWSSFICHFWNTYYILYYTVWGVIFISSLNNWNQKTWSCQNI